MEKPLSMDTFEEVTAVSDALKAAGTITSVGYMLRYVKGKSTIGRSPITLDMANTTSGPTYEVSRPPQYAFSLALD